MSSGGVSDTPALPMDLDLHERLMFFIAELELNTGGCEPAIGAVRAVVELHAPHYDRCMTCVEWCDCIDKDSAALVRDCLHGNVAYPCPTIAATASALGVESS